MNYPTDAAFRAAVAAELREDIRARVQALEAQRILRERDEDLQYEQVYGPDAYGGPRVLSCGCTPIFDCDYHAYVQEFVDAQPPEPIEEDFPCQFEDWSKR